MTQFDQRNISMMMDLYEMTMANGYFSSASKEDRVTFDVFYRNNPDGGGFAIFAGLEQVVEYIENLHFTEEDVAYFRSLNLFDDAFLDYLADYHFTGDVFAFPEGTIMYPNEPIITVSAPLIDAQLIETAILAQVNHHRDRDFAADRDHHGDPQYGDHKEAAELLQQGHADSEHHKTKRQELPVMVIPESEGCRPYPHPHRDQDPEHDIKRVSGKIPDVQPGKGQQVQYKGENNVDNKENIECPNEKGVFLPGEKIMPYIFPRPRRIRVPVFIKTVCAFWGRFLLKKQVYNEILELFFGYFHFCDQNYKKNYAEGFPKSCKSFKI